MFSCDINLNPSKNLYVVKIWDDEILKATFQCEKIMMAGHVGRNMLKSIAKSPHLFPIPIYPDKKGDNDE